MPTPQKSSKKVFASAKIIETGLRASCRVSVGQVRPRVAGDYLELPLPGKLDNAAAFSALLLDESFWARLRPAGNHVLVFQTDCALLRPPRRDDLRPGGAETMVAGFAAAP